MNPKETKQKRLRRHRRIRAKIKGTALRPRMSVFRSNRHLVVQLIDDTAGRTMVGVSDRDATGKRAGGRVALAGALGALIAEKASAHGITAAVFDRGGYHYHGMVRAIAEGARKGGLAF